MHLWEPFEKAKQWAQSQGIKTRKHWYAYRTSPGFPSNIPANPAIFYRTEWDGWRSFLGAGRVRRRRKYCSYEEAQRFALENNIILARQWRTAIRQKGAPNTLPLNPSVAYSSQWEGWREFLQRRVRGYSSITEEILSLELSQFLPVDRKLQRIYLPESGKSKQVDIAVPSKRLLIEYDGRRWHAGSIERDIRHTAELESLGWRVIRVREKPLQKLSSSDLVINPSLSHFKRSCAIIEHLLILGEIDDSFETAFLAYLNSGRLFATDQAIYDAASWRSFPEALKYARGLNLRSQRHWREHHLKVGYPSDLPVSLDKAYVTEWKGWGHFLGTNRRRKGDEEFVSYEEAKAYAQSIGVKTLAAWKELDLPANIPRGPSAYYRSMWSTEDFFGKKMRTFDEARIWARASGISSSTKWRRAHKAGVMPEDLPGAPDDYYRAAWQGWGNFLGTESKVGGQFGFRKAWRPFAFARIFARASGIATSKAWKANRDLPADIPRCPNAVYEEWVSWADWFGTRKNRKQWRPFSEAREFCRSQMLVATFKAWKEFTEDPGFPTDIPCCPWAVYERWISLDDWLIDPSTFVTQHRVIGKRYPYVPLDDAQAWARAQGCVSQPDWKERISKLRPPGIPYDPKKAYGAAWPGWSAFLGVSRHPSGSLVRCDIETAAKWAEDMKITSSVQWAAYRRRREIPSHIPRTPDEYYRARGTWVSWPHFLRRKSSKQITDRTLPTIEE